jgi:archaemetzincin
MSCKHTILQLSPSPFAELAGYEQPDAATRAAAETTSGRVPKRFKEHPTQVFPAPLVLPHDELNYDPDCSGQSVKSWVNEKARNKLGNGDGRDTLYIARVPEISKEVEAMREWTVPNGIQNEEEMAEGGIESPDVELFVEYLRAFYHGMDVQVLPSPLSWTSWSASKKTSTRPARRAALPKYIGLCDSSTKNTTRTRVRRPPDSVFPAQLNLDDILDTAISILPPDAYALLLLVDHDIYENEEDDFCCGRAYGGSRVAVVQTARYNPTLDVSECVDREHMWPMSHCKDFIDGLCKVEDVEPLPPTKSQTSLNRDSTMRKVVAAASSYTPHATPNTQHEMRSLWFSRLSRTASHELGHCFGIAHCIYYACNMQGCAGMKEDLRQPPYLCPVCEGKVGRAIAAELHGGKEEQVAWVKGRNEALMSFCEMVEEKGWGGAMWMGLGAWVEARQTDV